MRSCFRGAAPSRGGAVVVGGDRVEHCPRSGGGGLFAEAAENAAAGRAFSRPVRLRMAGAVDAAVQEAVGADVVREAEEPHPRIAPADGQTSRGGLVIFEFAVAVVQQPALLQKKCKIFHFSSADALPVM